MAQAVAEIVENLLSLLKPWPPKTGDLPMHLVFLQETTDAQRQVIVRSHTWHAVLELETQRLCSRRGYDNFALPRISRL